MSCVWSFRLWDAAHYAVRVRWEPDPRVSQISLLNQKMFAREVRRTVWTPCNDTAEQCIEIIEIELKLITD